ncbi:MAG: class I SAM-dependent methyltransferase [Christensenellales bacterium]|jgi:SAM-dependent methyltransferase
MTHHPGGEAQTKRLLALADLTPCRILDMGAGEGATLKLLRDLGFDAVGIDKAGKNGAIAGDFLHCPFSDGSFDAVLSECAFFVSGNPKKALSEAFRLLKKGGKLLLSDVYFGTREEAKKCLKEAGFRVLAFADETKEWKKYYIECIWRGTAEQYCGCARGRPCGYYLVVCERT